MIIGLPRRNTLFALSVKAYLTIRLVSTETVKRTFALHSRFGYDIIILVV